MLPAQAGMVALFCSHYRSLVWRGLASCSCRYRIVVFTHRVLVHFDQVLYSGEMEASLTVLSVPLMQILTSVLLQTLCVMQRAYLAAVV
jgi:hypothetical protein